jgi:hypothetical protein
MNRDKFGRFTRGHSGNVAGRPRGSRSKLGEVFITQLYADWLEHGETVIAKVPLPHWRPVVTGLLWKTGRDA